VSEGPAAQTTVVLTVWDEYVSTRLTEAVRSLASQGLAARIVVVDNASDVELPDLPGVAVVRSSQRLTLGAARNLGLQQRAAAGYGDAESGEDWCLGVSLAFRGRIGGASGTAASTTCTPARSGRAGCRLAISFTICACYAGEYARMPGSLGGSRLLCH
jgi:glycosyltransferase involved in cell wall biosynthesis